MMNSNLILKGVMFGAAGLAYVASVVGIVCASKNRRQVKDICKRLNVAYEDIVDGIEVNVDETVVESAVNAAANIAAREATTKEAQRAVRELKRGMEIDIRNSITNEVNSMKSSIKDEIKSKIGYIDISEAKQAVIDEASEKAKEKLDLELDAIATRFRTNLDDSAKILKVVANKLE